MYIFIQNENTHLCFLLRRNKEASDHTLLICPVASLTFLWGYLNDSTLHSSVPYFGVGCFTIMGCLTSRVWEMSGEDEILRSHREWNWQLLWKRHWNKEVKDGLATTGLSYDFSGLPMPVDLRTGPTVFTLFLSGTPTLSAVENVCMAFHRNLWPQISKDGAYHPQHPILPASPR